MTIQAITQRHDIQNQIHTAAAELVKLLDAAVVKAGGDEDEAREAILALVSDDDR
jgi:hypothetical protein